MKEEIGQTDGRLNILKYLFVYRATSAIQLAKIVYKTKYPTISNEKFIYGELAKLRKQGLVKMYKPQVHLYKYSLYFLSPQGLEYIQNSLDLVEGQTGDGWFPNNLDSHGWFKFEVYSPPLEQVVHHTMLVDFFINITVVEGSEIKHRNNLYAKRKTWSNHILRMDAEVCYGGKNIAIEIDRGSESHQQLIEKFKGYLRYFKDLETKNMEIDFRDILFIVDNIKLRDAGLKRRWLNVMAAFYKAMGDYAFKVDLHFCTLDDAYKLLTYEFNEPGYANTLFQTLRMKHNIEIDDFLRDNLTNKMYLALDLSDYYFTMCVQEYSTSIVRLYDIFKNHSIKCKDIYIACVHELPQFDYDLARYEVPKKIEQLFKELQIVITDENRIELLRVKEVIDGHLVRLG